MLGRRIVRMEVHTDQVDFPTGVDDAGEAYCASGSAKVPKFNLKDAEALGRKFIRNASATHNPPSTDGVSLFGAE